MQELLQLQSEIDQTRLLAQEAERTAQVAEALAQQMGSEIEQEQQTEETNPSSSQAEVEEIEEEEQMVEAGASIMIAEAAGAAAAEAEALAEASSVRTREARRLALQADQALEEILAAIRSGALTGEEAETNLEKAELEATRAHALLADAEAFEEHALSAAMNAEAEAEVAEGMAFASTERAKAMFADADIQVGDEESEVTLKTPVIRPQKEENEHRHEPPH